MRDSWCVEINRASELHQMFAYTSGSDSKKARSSSKKFDLSVLQDKGHRDYRFKKQSVPQKSRGKVTSKHFGVRFRPDLHKWVAEIRVAEWKSVDKKVWLGTFDTEIGAARAVDAARKLLKCKKKRPHNCPCMELDAYSERIPAHLNLEHLEDDAMFKDVTLFIKRKAQEYAASFCTASTTPFSPEATDVYLEPKMEFAFPCEISTSWSSHSNSEDDVDVHWNRHCDGSVSQHSSSNELWTACPELIDSTEQGVHETMLSWDDNTLFFDDEFPLDHLSRVDDPECLLQPDLDRYTHEQTRDHNSTDEVQHDNDNNFLWTSGNPFQKSSLNMVDGTMKWSQPQLYIFNNSSTPVH